MALRRFVIQDVQLDIDDATFNPPLAAALAEGRYEHGEAHALKSLLRAEDHYVELGGGVGFISTLAARIVRDPARVHVYEANPELLPVIAHNWRLNGVEGTSYNCMLGRGKGEHAFHVSRAFWASSGHIDYGHGRTIQVPQRDFIKQLQKRGATFLMMDIEGGERDLLDKPLPAQVRAVVAEYHPRIIGQETCEALWAHLVAQGFRAVPEACTGPVRAHVR